MEQCLSVQYMLVTYRFYVTMPLNNQLLLACVPTSLFVSASTQTTDIPTHLLQDHLYPQTVCVSVHPPIQITNYKSMTALYFANMIKCNLTFMQRLLNTKPLICVTPCYLNFVHLKIFMAKQKAICQLSS